LLRRKTAEVNALKCQVLETEKRAVEGKHMLREKDEEISELKRMIQRKQKEREYSSISIGDGVLNNNTKNEYSEYLYEEPKGHYERMQQQRIKPNFPGLKQVTENLKDNINDFNQSLIRSRELDRLNFTFDQAESSLRYLYEEKEEGAGGGEEEERSHPGGSVSGSVSVSVSFAGVGGGASILSGGGNSRSPSRGSNSQSTATQNVGQRPTGYYPRYFEDQANLVTPGTTASPSSFFQERGGESDLEMSKSFAGLESDIDSLKKRILDRLHQKERWK